MALSEITSLATKATSLWGSINKAVDEVQQRATELIMDSIIKNSAFFYVLTNFLRLYNLIIRYSFVYVNFF